MVVIPLSVGLARQASLPVWSHQGLLAAATPELPEVLCSTGGVAKVLELKG